MRLFFAILLEDEIKNRLYAVMKNMEPHCERCRLMPRENLHVTLVFLGEVPPGRLFAAQKALDAVKEKSFLLRIGGIGCFRRKEGDLYWTGIERTAPLVSVYSDLCSRLKEQGFSCEMRPYRPHLTLARRVILKNGDSGSAFDVPAMKMTVKAVSLMRSDRVDGRQLYTEVATKKLEGLSE